MAAMQHRSFKTTLFFRGVFLLFFSLNSHGETLDMPSSSLKPDETLVLIDTAASFDGSSNTWQVPLHAWVYEPEESVVRKRVIAQALESKYGLKVTDATRDNFTRRVNLFLGDNERGKTIVIRIAGHTIEMPPTQPNGHSYHTIRLDKNSVAKHRDGDVLTFSAILGRADRRSFTGRVTLVEPRGLSIISDIDDTVKITHVTDHAKMFDSTFYQAFQPTPGMVELYQEWTSKGAAIHFVSSSPWQLHAPLVEFFQAAGLPFATVSLKHVRFVDSTFFDLFKSGEETKPLQIEPILQSFPQREFILVGDSGEKDPEAYASLYRRYPEQIKGIFIRNVTDARSSDERFTRVFQGIAPAVWRLFDNPQEL